MELIFAEIFFKEIFLREFVLLLGQKSAKTAEINSREIFFLHGDLVCLKDVQKMYEKVR